LGLSGLPDAALLVSVHARREHDLALARLRFGPFVRFRVTRRHAPTLPEPWAFEVADTPFDLGNCVGQRIIRRLLGG
jgi:hypothetical protein